MGRKLRSIGSRPRRPEGKFCAGSSNLNDHKKAGRNGLILAFGFCVGAYGTFSLFGAGWILVALLLLIFKGFKSSRVSYLKLGLTIGLVVGVVAIMAMGMAGMITN